MPLHILIIMYLSREYPIYIIMFVNLPEQMLMGNMICIYVINVFSLSNCCVSMCVMLFFVEITKSVCVSSF